MHLDADQLLLELGWLRRLARSLVGSSGVDEDLVQETWLAASRAGGGVSRAWLAGTLRNLARRWHRTEARLRRREAEVARPEGVLPESMVERSELFGLVLAELRGLDEPFRSALLALYQEGLTVRAAAQQLGMPEDTLRWQRREGLARLRRRLDGSAETDWRAALLPLFDLPSMDLVSGGAAPAAALSPLASVGGLLMSGKLMLVAVFAVVVLVMVSLLPDNEEAGTLTPAAAAKLVAPVRAALPNTDQAPPEEVAREAVVAQVSAPVPGASSPAFDGPALAVSTVDSKGRPIPGARVWIGQTPDPVDGFWVSDAEGIALLPTPKQQIAYVSAVTATLYGQSPVIAERAGGEAQVVMFPDASLTVLVVDETGAPVEGVPIGKVGTEMRKTVLDLRSAVWTDKDGLCVMPHVLDDFKFSTGSHEFRVGPLGFFLQTPSVLVPRESLPAEPVRIELPPSGPLEVTVFNARNAVNEAAGTVRLALDPQPGAAREVPELAELTRYSLGGILEVPLDEGRAVVPFVGLGLELVAQSRKADHMDSTFGFARGPERAGVVATLELRPLAVTTEIVGEVRDVRGELLRETKMTGGVTMKRGLSEFIPWRTISTDSAGRFRLAVDDEVLVQWGAGMGFVLRLDSDPVDPLARSRAWTALPEDLEYGENDAGTLAMEAKIPALTGFALDPEGEGVEVTNGHLFLLGDPSRENGRSLFEQGLVTDGNRFAVYISGPLELDPNRGEVLMLAVGADGLPNQRIVVHPGERDLAVVFEEAAGLHGRLVSDVKRELSGYKVSFFSTDGAGQRVGQGWTQTANNGRFQIEGLPRTPCEIEVSEFGSDEVLAFLGNLLPGSDSPADQERLDTLRLGGPLFRYHVKAVDEEGVELPGVSFTAPDSNEVTAPYGGAELFWRSSQAPLVGQLVVPGYRTEDVSLHPGEQTITMQRGLEVLVRLASPIDLKPGEEGRLVLSARDHTEVIELVARGDNSFAGFVSRAGSYEVRVRLYRKGLVAGERPLQEGDGTHIEVAGTGAEEAFDVR